MSSPTTLSESALAWVQDAIRACLDSSQGFQQGADSVNDETIQAAFQEWSAARSQQASELRTIAERAGAHPEAATTPSADWHKLWLSWTSALNGGEPGPILVETARADDHILQLYDQALSDKWEEPMRELLERHYEAIKATNHVLHDLRDSYLDDD